MREKKPSLRESKLYKIDKSLTSLTRKREMTQITNIRNEKAAITPDSVDIKGY